MGDGTGLNGFETLSEPPDSEDEDVPLDDRNIASRIILSSVYSPATREYMRAAALDFSRSAAACGFLGVAELVFEKRLRPPAGFELAELLRDDDDRPRVTCAIMPVLGRPHDVVGDFVAWAIAPATPAQRLFFATYTRAASFLGAWRLRDARRDRPLRVFRRPEDWARASGEGICVLEPGQAARLADVPCRLVADDAEHALILRNALRDFCDAPTKVMVLEAGEAASRGG